MSLDLDKLKEVLGDKASEFNFDDLQIMPKNDFELLVNNYKNEVETTKTKSNKIGREEILKELKNDIGLDYDQRKNPENLKKAYIEKFGAPEPSDNSDLEERFRLQGEKYALDLKESNDRFETLQSTHKKESDNKLIHEALTTSFAEFDGKTHYKTKDLVSLAKANGDFMVVNGDVFQSQDGEPKKNKLLQAITTESFAKEMMLEDGYIKKAEGGRVIGDETKGGKYSMEEFIASQEAQGVSALSLQFDENMSAAQKDGTLEV
jgi:hypothetical protein